MDYAFGVIDMKTNRRKWRKLVLFAFILGVPATLILFFKSGTHQFNYLQYWGPKSLNGADTVYFSVESPVFTEYQTGRNFLLSDFEDKIIIAIVLGPTCPDDCAIQSDKFKLLIYDELANYRRKFHDVVIIAQVKDYYNNEFPDAEMINRYFKTDTSFMKLCFTDENLLFDFVPQEGGLNLLREEHAGIQGRKGYHQFALLIDKERHVRGVYDLSHSQRIRTLLEELRILKKEYTVKKSNKS